MDGRTGEDGLWTAAPRQNTQAAWFLGSRLEQAGDTLNNAAVQLQGGWHEELQKNRARCIAIIEEKCWCSCDTCNGPLMDTTGHNIHHHHICCVSLLAFTDAGFYKSDGTRLRLGSGRAAHF